VVIIATFLGNYSSK